MTTAEILERAKKAKRNMNITSDRKNAALYAMADSLIQNKDAILKANASDVESARGQMNPVMIDRLMLDEARIEGMAKGIRDVAALADPVGEVLSRVERANGLVI